MDLSEETRASHKREFLKFFDQAELNGELSKSISTMISHNRRRLIIDLSDFFNHKDGRDLARRLLNNPTEYMQSLADSITDLARTVNAKYLKEGEQVLVGLTGPFVSRNVTPRDLLSSFIGSMVCVVGIVTKCSLVRPKVVKSVHSCPKTGAFTVREYRDITSNMGLPTGSVYPTRDENGNLLVTEYGLCTYKDHQTLSMQEMPENSAPGQLPRTVDIIVEDDLVDSCKPGDRVAIAGIYKALAGKTKGSMNGVFRTVLVGNNVNLLNKAANSPEYSTDDLKHIKTIAKREDVFDLLGNSLAPSIYGHLWIKKALVLLMLGGTEKNLKNGTHLRGDINMMMVGDPSVAKSQLLRAIMNIAPLAISTTGRGSSGVGLTAAVTSDQETGERRLEAGAMVLADRGVVCIDEFDKMNDQDRVAIHEVMEQQTVTIAKAGIHASLNARCSVVAAANPIYGTYDRSITPTKNIGLPDSLLSRFDLLFIVLDQMDPTIDRKVSEHVLRMHQFVSPNAVGGSGSGNSGFDKDEQGEKDPSPYVKYNARLHGKNANKGVKRDTLTINFLKKYIHYAKHRIQPELTDESSDQIANAYTELRNASSNAKSGGGTLPITARSLETIIRLSTAHAKLKLRNRVLKNDVDAALQVLNFAIYHQELNEMEERERVEAEAEERKRKAAADTDNNDDQGDNNNNGGGPPTKKSKRKTMDAPATTQAAAAQDPPAEAEVEAEEAEPQDRVEAFISRLGKHALAQHITQMVITDVGAVVNVAGTPPYSPDEIMAILEVMHERGILMLVKESNLFYII